jgi:NitT/TauT family transport system substrate-binding protein
MRAIRYLIFSCVMLTVLVGLIGCPGRDSKKDNLASEITMCQYGDLLIYLPLYIAQDQGFFEKENLKVKFINGGGDDKTFAAVSSGSAQFGVSDPTFTAIARERGRKGVVVATVVAGATYWGVTWNKDIQPTKTAAGLKDLRIATYEAPSTNYALMAKTLQENKDAVGKARIVQGAYGTLLATLKAGQADIAMELEPVASTAVKDGARIVFSYPEMYGPFLLTGIYTLEDYRDKNPATVQGVVNALEKAVRFAHKDPQGAIAVAKRKFPDVDSEVIVNAVERMIRDKTLPEHISLNRDGWKNTVTVRIELGELKSREIADQTLDDSFALKAVSAEK